MDVHSLGVARVGSFAWRTPLSTWTLTVVVKLTYRLAPTISELAAEQEDPNDEDHYWNDDPARSLYAARDLVPFKRRPEVMLVGHAFSPNGEAVRSIRTRLLVGNVDKSIEAFVDRSWSQDGVLRFAPRLAKMPLRWERATGGPDTENPVGVVLGGAADAFGNVMVPNLQPPELSLAAPSDYLPTAGFGPIAASWPSRARKLGPKGLDWVARGDLSQPLPEDLEAAYFQAAPADQELAELRTNERIVLENLHREHPRLVTSLSGHTPVAFVVDPEAAPFELRLAPDTLWIDTDRSLCSLTFRGQLPLRDRDQPGFVQVGLAAPGERLGWAELEAQARANKPREPPRSIRPRQDTELRGGVRSPSSVRAARADDLTRTVEGVAEDFVAGLRDALPFNKARRTRSNPAAEPTPAPAPIAVPGLVSPTPKPGRVAPGLAPSPWASASVAPGIADAARWGSGAASNAAAAELAAPRALPSPPPSAPRPKSDPPLGAGVGLDLLWFDPASVPRFRTAPNLRAALGDRKDLAWDESDAPVREPQETHDRADVQRILARTKALEAPEATRTLERSFDDDGSFQPAVVVIAGELQITFEKHDLLAAILAVGAPFSTNDKRLKDAIGSASEIAKLGASAPPDVLDGTLLRVREAFDAAYRAMAQAYLDSRAERALLIERRFAERAVFGEKRVRGEFSYSGASAPVPCYLPQALAGRWPLLPRLRVRVIAELRYREDGDEMHPEALVAFAVARELKRA
jgi:hypothetical protein